MNNAIKVKELWRDSSGHFAKAPEPVVAPVIKETTKEDGSIIIAATLGGSSLLMAAIVHWKVSLPILVAGVIVWALYRQSQKEYRSLVINQGGKSTVIKI
jgi:hypothetical protein